MVVYDYLANDTLLGYARPDAERIYVGKVAGNHALPQDGINKLIIEKAKEGITNLLKQTADNSIAKSGAFQKMEKQKSDINFFASMAAIPAPYQEQVSMGLPAEVKAEDITIIAGLNFEKGRIALKGWFSAMLKLQQRNAEAIENGAGSITTECKGFDFSITLGDDFKIATDKETQKEIIEIKLQGS